MSRLHGPLFGALLVISPMVSAQFTVIDVAHIKETVAANAQAMRIWAEEQSLIKKGMDQAGMNTGLEVDAINNAIANQIVRESLRAEDIQNREVLADAMPAMDACDAVSSAINIESFLCVQEAETQEAAERHNQRRNTLDITDEAELEAHIEQAVTSLAAECRDLSSPDGSNNACLSTQDLLGGTLPAMTPEQARATEAQIALLVDPIPEQMVNPRVDPSLNEAERVYAMRELALKSLATNSLMSVRAERLSIDNQPSRLQLLKDFANARYGTEEGAEFLAVITNTHPDKTTDSSKMSTQTQVMRSMAVMDAFMVYLEVIKYEQQLRMEALQAALLSVAVDPIQ